jgi:hypothetical protein
MNLCRLLVSSDSFTFGRVLQEAQVNGQVRAPA